MPKDWMRPLIFVLMLVISTLKGYIPMGIAIAASPPLELVGITRIWDQAPHNAFTDLVRYQGRWWAVFREGQQHVSADGALRIITSLDGETWESAALLRSEVEDMRDGKLSITPDGRLMLIGAGAHNFSPGYHQTYAWFSSDGRNWSAPVPIGERNYWLWRVTWSNGVGYGIGYTTDGLPRGVRLYKTTDGTNFTPLVADLGIQGYPNETAMVFLRDETAVTLLRRDPVAGQTASISSAMLGVAQPPYTHWTWLDTQRQIGGPSLIILPDGRLLAAVRLYDGNTRTALCWVDLETGQLTEAVTLPSGGDTSYAGLAWFDDMLWVSYYSSHEGQTAIYLAQVRLANYWIAAPIKSATVSGQVPIQVTGAAQNQSVTVTLVSNVYQSTFTPTQIYSGSVLPDHLVLDSLLYPDGPYKLVVQIVTLPGYTETLELPITIGNWNIVEDAMDPPKYLGSWLGVVPQMRNVGQSDGWEHTSSDAESFMGDTGRIRRKEATYEYLAWECAALARYAFTMYAQSDRLHDAIILEVSADGLS